MVRLIFSILLISALPPLMGRSAVSAQPVRSARVVQVPPDQPGATVILQNLRGSATWAVELVAGMQRVPMVTRY